MKSLFTVCILMITISNSWGSLLLVSHKSKHARKLAEEDNIDPNQAVTNLDMFTNTLHSINSDLETDRGILSMAKRQAYAVLDDVIGKMSAKANTSNLDGFLQRHAGPAEPEEDGDEERLKEIRI